MSSEVTGQTQISTSTTNIVVPLYPSLPANFVQGTPFQVPNQGHILSLPYQERSQDYYYNENTVGPKISLEYDSRNLMALFQMEGVGPLSLNQKWWWS
jgi:hypothetical protein